VGQGNGIKVADERRLLVERVASSRYVNRSARLRDMLLYLSDRVLNEEAGEIHEQEVGHRVFGRPANYDTTTDNIVRVHASMLRKRLEQYFATEGAGEPLILEIPKGNYAPLFHERAEVESVPLAAPPARAPAGWRLWTLAGVAVLFACTTAVLLLRTPGRTAESPDRRGPTVRQFWSLIFRPERPTDIVLDDAAVGLYQELSGKSLSLSEYFDRSYLRGLSGSEADDIVLRRQSSAASVSFLWKLFQLEGAGGRRGLLRFARDYTFRELKADNAVLLGNVRSNPWMQPFESRMVVRWLFDKAAGVYYPVDSSAGKSFQTASAGESHEGYFSVALLPNLGGSGSVLIIGGTGGSAINASADFLADEAALSELLRKLPGAKDRAFPYFEALVKVKGRSALPKEDAVVIARVP
jgi:hypothetical protein